MSGFVFGEVDTHERNAYDAANDLPKSHPWYPSLAGLDGALAYTANPVAAGGFSDLENTAGANIVVPAGKTLFVTEIVATAQTGKVQVNMAVGGSVTVAVMTPAGGGCIFVPFQTPPKVTAGVKLNLQVYNADLVNAANDLKVRLHYILL